MIWLRDGLLVCATVAGMEIVAWALHKYVMHGIGWGWHRSHHMTRSGALETNDLYGCIFAALATALFVVKGHDWLRPVGIGMCVYGACYAVLHDMLVHRRGPWHMQPRGRFLKHLVHAHKLHHAARTRDGAVSFGFLYAPPIRRLAAALRERRHAG